MTTPFALRALRARERIMRFVRENPALAVILVLGLFLRGIGVGWGLPASDTWDNDGVAPRDFLPGLVATYTPGDFYTYPPFHLALLALLTLPFTIFRLAHVSTFSEPALVSAFIQVPTMTAFAVVARLVALAMSVGIVYLLAELAGRIGGKSAEIVTALVATVHVPFVYYAHTSNLDVPYFFWALLSLRAFFVARERAKPEGLKWAFLFAVFAIATKDQAYGLFVFSVPFLLASWLLSERPLRGSLLRATLLYGGAALALLLFIDGAVTNPSGFAARLAFLRGPASQDFATYPKTGSGIARLLRDLAAFFPRCYPALFAVPLTIGVVRAIRTKRVLGALPLLAALSFTLAFNFVARRVEDRFVLPQTLLCAIYIGLGLDAIVRAAFTYGRVTGGVCLLFGLAAFGFALVPVINVDILTLRDPRYSAEKYLEATVRPGETIEVHGLNVYLPRFPEKAHVVRVGGPGRRNPLPGVEEKVDLLMNVDVRRPEWIVAVECFTWRYLRDDGATTAEGSGRKVPDAQLRDFRSDDARQFFQRLYHDGFRYDRALKATWPEDGFWKRIDMHASLGCTTTVFRRIDP